ncbi:MAG: hypothetical protein IJU44_04535 [Kiritimatiellae bacterium]|nr:hypothetical protein [Kiritimatiellia bacterium]
MKSIIEQFVASVRSEARRKPETLTIKAMGKERQFIGYDWGSDTFVFEKDAWRQFNVQHTPVLIVRKRDMIKNANGYIFTLTTGNHSVAAIPLLSGQFWNLGRVPTNQRSEILCNCVVCANVVNGHIEISQRDVDTRIVTKADEWLQNLGIPLNGVVMSERNDKTLEFYRQQGQEWRIKPLAWTSREMKSALNAAHTRINSDLRYYHSVKGVHFLSYAEFHKLSGYSIKDFDKLVTCLREMVSIFEGNSCSFMRMPKFHGHHEVELFGVRRGIAEKSVVPEIEKLMEAITLKRITPEKVLARVKEIDALICSSLDRPSLADETSSDFMETLYMHLTGEIYYTHNDLGSLAFDDRRTALPGATFRGGRADFHPGADERTRVLLSNVEQMLSQGEIIEYANIYEVRTDNGETDTPQQLGEGVTREILFKTNRRPLCTSMIEKRLALSKPGYGNYMLARVQAFKALGVNFGMYRLLMREDSGNGKIVNYFIRNRCEGEPLDDIPGRIYKRTDGNEGEDPNAVQSIAALLGNAAAENMALKKYLPNEGCRFCVGKEVFRFGYDITLKRELPTGVSLCSVRGCLGWPNLNQNQDNLDKMFNFYLDRYAEALVEFWRRHRQAADLDKLADQFWAGFEFSTRKLHWNYNSRREQFDAFDPKLPVNFNFVRKWRFALWALDIQASRLRDLAEMFRSKVALHAVENEG